MDMPKHIIDVNVYDFTTYILTCRCITCHEIYKIIVSKGEFNSWLNGNHAKDCFPEFTLSELDALKFGTCLNCSPVDAIPLKPEIKPKKKTLRQLLKKLVKKTRRYKNENRKIQD